MRTVVDQLLEILDKSGFRTKDNLKKDVRDLFEKQIKEAYKAGEKNIDFPALHGQGKLSDCDKYFNETFNH
jgi:hypothetical protein